MNARCTDVTGEHALIYCRGRVAPPGSSLHYALLRLDDEALHRALCVHAVVRELCDTVEGTSDAAVAHRKLAWWLEEIERAQSGNAAHPAAQLLQRSLASPGALAPAVVAAERVLHERGCESFEDLERYGAQTAGLALRLALPDAADDDAACKLGAALTLVRALSELRRRDGHAAALLPGASLRQHGVEDTMLYAECAGPALVAHTREHARRALAAFTGVGACESFANALRAMAIASLRKLERNRFDALGRDMNLAPVRKLWVAWRNA